MAGDNRKLLVFPLAEVNEMVRGRGVRLQKYRDGGLADALAFTRASGLPWTDPAGRTRQFMEVEQFDGARAAAGQVVPKGFPKSNRFGIYGFDKN